MTKEEAIKRFQRMKKILSIPNSDAARTIEAIDMAIEALTYQSLSKPNNTCEVDLIRREDAIEAVEKAKTARSADGEIFCAKINAQMNIQHLPSVQPERKRGEWRKVSAEKYVQHALSFYRCSECGWDVLGEPNFCPSCGADMRGEE